jgi:hypothetical protein
VDTLRSVTTHVIVNHDWFDVGFAVVSLLVAVVAVGIALRAQHTVGQERRRVFELGILTRILEHYSRGLANYQGENVVSRLLDALPKEDLPTLREWLAEEHRVTDKAVADTITTEYRDAIQRRL